MARNDGRRLRLPAAVITASCEIIGLAAITYGVFLVADWAGFLTLGLALWIVGWILGE